MLDKLLKLSPVPVKFTNILTVYGLSGGYFCKGKFSGNVHIEVEDRLSIEEKIACLIHEIGHAKCDKKGCKCYATKDNASIEYHAFQYALKWLLKNKQKEALKGDVDLLLHLSKHNYAHYTEAAKRIMKLKLWKKCLDYIQDV